ncbi:MAG: right-handed parallel beta-helix repeat-containing protein [Planctomycetaceae bacterium]
MAIDFSQLLPARQPQPGLNARFLITRCVGLCGLLWLYSLQADDSQLSPPILDGKAPAASKAPETPAAPAAPAAPKEATPEAPPTQRITIPPTIKDFGATGDGDTDDSAAIQKAVDGGLKPLHFPAGTYRITKTIEIRLDKVGPLSITGDGVARIQMEAAGPALRIVGSHQGTADPQTVTNTTWDRQRSPLIDGIEINGKHGEAGGIELSGTLQATLSRLTIRGVVHAIRLINRNRNVQISECHLYDNRGVGVFMDTVNLHQINIGNNHISYNRQGGIVARDSEIRNLQITGCDIEGNVGDGPLAANVLLDCRRGSVREGAITGCTLQHDHNFNGAANIRMLGASKENTSQVGTFVIGNNVLSDVKTNIHLKFARGIVIQGNSFWEGYDQNILAENCTQLLIGQNLFDRNPDQKDLLSRCTVELKECTDCVISGLRMHDIRGKNAALTLDSCSWCIVNNCMITDSGETLVDLMKCDNCRLNSCVFRAPHNSIWTKRVRVTGGHDNLVSDDSR